MPSHPLSRPLFCWILEYVVVKWSMTNLIQSIAVLPNTLMASYPVAVKYYVVQMSVWEGSSVIICIKSCKKSMKIKKSFSAPVRMCTSPHCTQLIAVQCSAIQQSVVQCIAMQCNADYPVEERWVSGRRGRQITSWRQPPHPARPSLWIPSRWFILSLSLFGKQGSTSNWVSQIVNHSANEMGFVSLILFDGSMASECWRWVTKNRQGPIVSFYRLGFIFF